VIMAATVLVVEDDACIRDLVLELLGGEGWKVVGAGNGEEALRRLREGPVRPELILLDLMMPVMDGWQFRAEQLRDPTLAQIPVVLMSASPEEVAAEVSVDDRVPKPFDIDALLRAVTRHVSRSPAP